MLRVILFSLVSTSSAATSPSYDTYDSFDNYRPSEPLLHQFFGYGNSNGRPPVQVYEYSKRYGVVISDVYPGPAASGDGGRRRVDTPYSYQNPHQRNRQIPWDRVVVTEPAKIFNRFEHSNEDSYPDSRSRSPVVQQAMDDDINELNKTEGNFSVNNISTQLDDVNHTLVINEQPITWNNDHQGSREDNITTRSITSDDKTNSLNASTKQNADKINRPTKTNNRTGNNNNRPNNNSNIYNTETTKDNEVTPRAHEQRTKPHDEDRWIWSNGQDQVVTTTVKTDFDDRAAFAADACPVGKLKVGNICVEID